MVEFKSLFRKKGISKKDQPPKTIFYKMFIVLMFIFGLSIILLEFKQITAIFYEILMAGVRFFTLPLYIQRYTLFFIIFIVFVLSIKLSPSVYIPNLNITMFYYKKRSEGDLIYFKTFKGYTIDLNIQLVQKSFFRYTTIAPVYMSYESDHIIFETAELEVTKNKILIKKLNSFMIENSRLNAIIGKNKEDYIHIKTFKEMKEKTHREDGKE